VRWLYVRRAPCHFDRPCVAPRCPCRFFVSLRRLDRIGGSSADRGWLLATKAGAGLSQLTDLSSGRTSGGCADSILSPMHAPQSTAGVQPDALRHPAPCPRFSFCSMQPSRHHQHQPASAVGVAARTYQLLDPLECQKGGLSRVSRKADRRRQRRPPYPEGDADCGSREQHGAAPADHPYGRRFHEVQRNPPPRGSVRQKQWRRNLCAVAT
jgi:hypothetical protein